MRTRIKICGITRPEDALAAAQSGADAIGFVFYAESPRYIEPQAARVIASQLPPFVTKVGLFVDASADEVRATREVVGLDLLQFHGVEPAEYCQGFARPYIKVIHMRPDVDWRQVEQDYASATGLLVDTYTPQHGGSGVVFDWQQLPSDLSKPLIVAGGLTPENVAQVIAKVRPYGVDVSSGVEQAKGIKDAAKIAAFINEVNRQQ